MQRLARLAGVTVGVVAGVIASALPASACTSADLGFKLAFDLSLMPAGVQELGNTIFTGSVIALIIAGAVAIVATVVSRRAQNPDGTATGASHVARIGFAALGLSSLPLLIGMGMALGAGAHC